MPNYSNGKVYEIICRITSERYIGSTIDTLPRRLSKHRTPSNTCISKTIISRGDYYINLLEECDCENRMQLLKKEREWYDKLKCINLIKPFANVEEKKEYQKEYRNKEQAKEYYKEYYEENKEQAKEYYKEYYEENREQAKEQAKKYYEKNKEYRKEYYKEYYKKNKKQKI